MSELQTVRKKIQGDFFLEKSYKNGKLFYEVLRYKDDYIGINYGYLEDKLSEETYINDNRIGMLISNEKEKIQKKRSVHTFTPVPFHHVCQCDSICCHQSADLCKTGKRRNLEEGYPRTQICLY